MRSSRFGNSEGKAIYAAAAGGVRMAAVLLVAVAMWAAAASPEQTKTATSISPAKESPLPGLDAVISDLRKGGLVIYFRHGTTDQTGPNGEGNLADCATQRNLSAEGRDQATEIGRAFRSLGIPVGAVTTSPLCRCKDTAKLAFDRFTVSDDLYYVINTDAAKTKQLAEALRLRLSTPPAGAANSVIVSHNANLREATGLWPKPEGVAFVFRPLPGGRFEVMARIPPEEWANVAKRK